MPRRERPRPSNQEFAILGLLLLGPKHGYELIAELSRIGAGDVFEVEPSTLYSHLKSLQRAGLAEWQEERAGNRPPRKTYRLTAAGRAAAEAWLREPVDRLRLIRQEFVLKLALLQVLGRKEAARRLTADQLTRCEAYLAELRGRNPSTPVGVINRGAKESAAVATIAWLRSLLAGPEVLAS
ncbi:MAG: hypothetical protein KatS3mg062_0268 [Tepidiforma sp.]|nr:MAG: hypothetical protein KatS3mg062_0268 [Tepidiforma sp.]